MIIGKKEILVGAGIGVAGIVTGILGTVMAGKLKKEVNLSDEIKEMEQQYKDLEKIISDLDKVMDCVEKVGKGLNNNIKEAEKIREKLEKEGK